MNSIGGPYPFPVVRILCESEPNAGRRLLTIFCEFHMDWMGSNDFHRLRRIGG
jgi:hypothetical protein